MLDAIGGNWNVMAMQLDNEMLKMVRACQKKIAQQEKVEGNSGDKRANLGQVGPFWAMKDHFGSQWAILGPDGRPMRV